MVVKKQLRKISKKILVLGLATSIIFTSCFSTKKIEAHATGIATVFGAYSLYQICLYIGGIVATTIGVGYVYENRDDIAELGKDIIDSLSDFPVLGWVLGYATADGDYVFGSEALREVKDTSWEVIQGGGQSPKNDNDGDGDKDEDDILAELNLNKMFLTSFGISYLKNHIKELYDGWVEKDMNVFTEKFGDPTLSGFLGFKTNEDGKYVGSVSYTLNGTTYTYDLTCNNPIACFIYKTTTSNKYVFQVTSYNGASWNGGMGVYFEYTKNDTLTYELHDIPCHVSDNSDARSKYQSKKIHPIWTNAQKNFRIADWLADEDAWAGVLEDLGSSLRSLQGLTDLAQNLTSNTINNMPTYESFYNTYNDYVTNVYPSVTNYYITAPNYYPSTNITPHLDISVFPNYDIYIQNGGGADTPDDGGGEDDIPEIDLDGLLSIFNILFYLIMIIVMLIYLFLSCLAFIVMIFRIPASSSMLPEDMVLGYEHLKTIMIPGMNISIYGFAMALIYLFIIFAVIKLIRLEINDFKFPRSYK